MGNKLTVSDEPMPQEIEDRDTVGLAARLRDGDRVAFNLLYERYVDRVYSHMRLLLNDVHEAEDATQEVFIRMLRGISGYEARAGSPFRAWLFRIARNCAMDYLQRRHGVCLEEPKAIRRRRETMSSEMRSEVLDWLSDADLVMLIERLPIAQRQVLTLRYMLDLGYAEIAEILGRSPSSVRQLHHRAVEFLEDRLDSLGRRQQLEQPEAPMRKTITQQRVLRARRFALTAEAQPR